jgi:hypothetical protein
MKQKDATMQNYIDSLRKLLSAANHHSLFESDGRGADNSKAKIFTYRRRVPKGHYFLCDCIGNTVDLCYSTEKKYKNPAGRMVECKVIETLIPDARKQLGSPVNGCWQIPYHLLNY